MVDCFVRQFLMQNYTKYMNFWKPLINIHKLIFRLAIVVYCHLQSMRATISRTLMAFIIFLSSQFYGQNYYYISFIWICTITIDWMLFYRFFFLLFFFLLQSFPSIGFTSIVHFLWRSWYIIDLEELFIIRDITPSPAHLWQFSIWLIILLFNFVY